MFFVFFCADGVPSSQNPTVAIESWINHNKVEREEFSCILQENLKVIFPHAEPKLIFDGDAFHSALMLDICCYPFLFFNFCVCRKLVKKSTFT